MNENTFFIIWGVGMGLSIAVPFMLGRKALSIFPEIKSVNVRFREKYASGRSNDSFITKAGGASGVLDVVVTENELWLKTMLFMAWFAKLYKLLHRIELSRIIRTEEIGKRKLDIYFYDEDGTEKSVTLKLKNQQAFLKALEQE